MRLALLTQIGPEEWDKAGRAAVLTAYKILNEQAGGDG